MKALMLAFAACATLSTLHAEETCSLSTLLNDRPLSAFPRVDRLPSEADPDGKHEHVSLYCAHYTAVSDAFGYGARLDRKRGIAWVHQYGGYAGVYQWYGPIPVAAEVIDWCISHQSACPPRLDPDGTTKAQ